MSPTQFLDETRLRINEVRESLLSRHLDTVGGPDEWAIPVEAYCVLCHAAFEELIEAVSDYASSQVGNRLMGKTPLPRFTGIYIGHYFGNESIISQGKLQDSEFDILRKLIDAAKQKHSNVIQKNHGISIEQLRDLLVPVGMYIAPNPEESDALERLINQRHTVAHLGMDRRNERKEAAKKYQGPEDAVALVEDSCLPYFQRVVEKAESYFASL